jgi:photosystem II stability/assembly factor-like uncharacterized protein
MKKYLSLIPFLFVSSLFLFTAFLVRKEVGENEKESKELLEPADWAFLQKSYPNFGGNDVLKQYEYAIKIAKEQMNQSRGIESWTQPWRLEGPTNTGGRFNCLAIHPTNENIIYAGTASGGVFKTIDGGANWLPIFDQNPFLSIGTIVFDPTNANTIYVGTGDPQISGYPFVGDGIYKSTDAGQTWTNIGMSQGRIITKILINPNNTNIIYAAAMGLPFVKDNNRGLYKTTNGGQTWTQVLFVSDQAGIIDMVMDPTNPNIVYAASWDRIRNMQESIVSGPNGKIWKTTDAGQTWNTAMNGFPTGNLCRIGLAISQQNPNVLYATYATTALEFGGLLKTVDGGANWLDMAAVGLDPTFQSNFAWYFGKIGISPTNDNHIWMLGVTLYKSFDGGSNFTDADANYNLHADKHDLEYDKNGKIWLATDGGLYTLADANNDNWQDADLIPNNQFYRVALNPNDPAQYYGGVQDNGCNGGSYLAPSSWIKYGYGDGFQMRFEPNSPAYYVESQNLGLAYNDGMGNFYQHTNGIDGADRRSWDAPFTLSAFNYKRQYTGTYRVYRNTKGGGMQVQWDTLSSDLTDGIIFFDRAHVISWVEESPVDSQVIYACTSDANVHVTKNDGLSWQNITTSNLPDYYATSIHPSTKSAGTAWLTFSGYRWNDNTSHIYKTTDFGLSWVAIASNLPPFAINDVAIYSQNENVLFVATDGGIYGTVNGGLNWERVGDMPILAVYDVEIDEVNNRIVAGTFARSLQTYDLNEILLNVKNTDIVIFSALSVFPNPAIDKVYFKITEASRFVPTEMQVFDMKGNVILRDCFQPELNVSEWSSGIYTLQVKAGNKIWAGKIVKN